MVILANQSSTNWNNSSLLLHNESFMYSSKKYRTASWVFLPNVLNSLYWCLNPLNKLISFFFISTFEDKVKNLQAESSKLKAKFKKQFPKLNFEYEVRKEKGEDAQEEDDAPDSIIPLLALHTTAQIVKCMKNSFAKRCIKANFVSLVDRVISATNLATVLVAIVSSSFSARALVLRLRL